MSYTATVTQQWNGRDVKLKGKRVVGKSAYETGLIVEGQAKALAPKNFGYLAASITTQADNRGTELGRPTNPAEPAPSSFRKIASPTGDDVVLVGTAVEYAPYQEFGTVRSNAQPFLRPALDLAQGKTLTILERNGRFEFREYLR